MEPADKPPIKDLLEHYGADNVIDRGSWAPVKCPFHEDRSASASVNTGANTFKCHTCDFGGDSFALVMWQEAIKDFGSAVEFCERILGGSYGAVPQSGKGKRRRRSILDEEVRAPVAGQRSILSVGRRRRPVAGS
jgi:DNA primase